MKQINTLNLNMKKVFTNTYDYYEVRILSLQLTYGDWGIRDCVRVYDNYIKFNKNSKLISFKQTLQKEILGQQR